MSQLPQTITRYLDQLRSELRGSDPALVQDALYDAEEYLRSEWSEHPELDEAGLLASVAGSYGAPAEVADIYRETEATVVQALRPPPPKPRHSALGKFFGVLADPQAYTSLLYLLLSLGTGIFYFTWAVAGVSMTLGMAALIVGIPFAIVFFASVRGLSLVEGRLVEALLGERMPRRPPYAAGKEQPLLTRIKELFLDPRTWSTLLYMLLMLPLGLLYFTLTVTALSLSLALALMPIAQFFGASFTVFGDSVLLPLWSAPVTIFLGLVALVGVLHAASGVGSLHAQLAKQLLVKSSRVG